MNGNQEMDSDVYDSKDSMPAEQTVPSIPIESVLHALQALRSLLIAAEDERDALRIRLADTEAAAAMASEAAAAERAADRVRHRAFVAQLQGQVEALPKVMLAAAEVRSLFTSSFMSPRRMLAEERIILSFIAEY
jgi:hypothetical protein